MTMTEKLTTPITAEIRDGVAKVMDLVLPGTELLPSATEVGAQNELLDRVLQADPTLAPIVIHAGLEAQNGVFDFATLREWMGDELERFVFALHAAYYMSSEVRERLGYPGQRRLPLSMATSDQLCSDELIAPVVSRGPIYVSTPSAQRGHSR